MGRGTRVLATAIVDRRLKLRRLSGGVEIANDVYGAELVRFGGDNIVGRMTKFAGNVGLGHRSTIGDVCYFSGTVEIGAYTQIAPHVTVFANDHPMYLLTMYGPPRARREGMPLPELREEGVVRIGHGVWIGANSLLLKNASVGNGAIIGGGSVVTSAIPPYAIAVGNPARVVGTRFDERLQWLVERTGWWTRPIDQLEPLRKAFAIDASLEPERFEAALLEFLGDDEPEYYDPYLAAVAN